MGERPRSRPPVVQWEYQFDRLLPDKLARAYEVLVPDRRWRLGGSRPAAARRAREVTHDPAGGHLRARLLGS